MKNIVKKWTESSLILKIFIGLIIGAILGLTVPQIDLLGLPGELFVSALKAIAPLLVFMTDIHQMNSPDYPGYVLEVHTLRNIWKNISRECTLMSSDCLRK